MSAGGDRQGGEMGVTDRARWISGHSYGVYDGISAHSDLFRAGIAGAVPTIASDTLWFSK
jgi:hypothetical protein